VSGGACPRHAHRRDKPDGALPLSTRQVCFKRLETQPLQPAARQGPNKTPRLHAQRQPHRLARDHSVDRLAQEGRQPGTEAPAHAPIGALRRQGNMIGLAATVHHRVEALHECGIGVAPRGDHIVVGLPRPSPPDREYHVSGPPRRRCLRNPWQAGCSEFPVAGCRNKGQGKAPGPCARRSPRKRRGDITFRSMLPSPRPKDAIGDLVEACQRDGRTGRRAPLVHSRPSKSAIDAPLPQPSMVRQRALKAVPGVAIKAVLFAPRDVGGQAEAGGVFQKTPCPTFTFSRASAPSQHGMSRPAVADVRSAAARAAGC